jgi:hypothetical protein
VRTGNWELMERTNLRDLAQGREPENSASRAPQKPKSFNPFRAVGP